MTKKKITSQGKENQILNSIKDLGTMLNSRIDGLSYEIKNTNSRIDGLSNEIKETNDRIIDLNSKTNDRIDDLASIVADLNCKTNERIDYLASYMKEGFTTVNQRLDSTLTRKEFLAWVHKYDGSLKEIREARRNRLLFENQFVDLDDQVAGHENRIIKLEQNSRV